MEIEKKKNYGLMKTQIDFFKKDKRFFMVLKAKYIFIRKTDTRKMIPFRLSLEPENINC